MYEPGIAAATMFTPGKMTEVSETQLRVAFDGDAVLFSDESERIYKAHGLEKFFEHEKAHENKLLDHVGHTLTDIIFQLMEMMTELFSIDWYVGILWRFYLFGPMPGPSVKIEFIFFCSFCSKIKL